MHRAAVAQVDVVAQSIVLAAPVALAVVTLNLRLDAPILARLKRS
jgi:hypothetical protein